MQQENPRHSKKTILLFILVTIIQLVVIGGILYRILLIKKQTKVLSATTESGNDNSGLFKPVNTEFKYYYELSPSYTKIESRFWNNTQASLTINDDGFNERYNYSVVKPDNTYRIITLGDSFTYGQEVNTPRNWPERLEDKLNSHTCSPQNKFEVINLGMIGFDVPYIIKRYKDKGEKYKPDLIVWYESGTGFYRDRERMDPLRKNCEDALKIKKGSDKLTVVDRDSCWVKVQDDLKSQTPLEDVKKRISDWMEYFLSLVGNTPVIILTSPATDTHHKEVIQALISKHSNLFLQDSATDIKPANGTALSSFDWHPNERGHDSIAQDAYEYFVSNKEIFATNGIGCTK